MTGREGRHKNGDNLLQVYDQRKKKVLKTFYCPVTEAGAGGARNNQDLRRKVQPRSDLLCNMTN